MDISYTVDLRALAKAESLRLGATEEQYALAVAAFGAEGEHTLKTEIVTCQVPNDDDKTTANGWISLSQEACDKIGIPYGIPFMAFGSNGAFSKPGKMTLAHIMSQVKGKPLNQRYVYTNKNKEKLLSRVHILAGMCKGCAKGDVGTEDEYETDYVALSRLNKALPVCSDSVCPYCDCNHKFDCARAYDDTLARRGWRQQNQFKDDDIPKFAQAVYDDADAWLEKQQRTADKRKAAQAALRARVRESDKRAGIDLGEEEVTVSGAQKRHCRLEGLTALTKIMLAISSGDEESANAALFQQCKESVAVFEKVMAMFAKTD